MAVRSYNAGAGTGPTTNPVSPAQGGTGDTTLTAHAVLVGEGTAPVAQVGPGAVQSVLIGNGASADPSFSATPTVTTFYSVNGVATTSTGAYSWSSSTTDPTAALQAALYSDGANAIGQRNSTNAQTFNAYTTYTNASNYERIALTTSDGMQGLLSQGAGTGTAQSIGIGQGTTFYWVVNSSGAWFPTVTSSWDLGLPTRTIRDLYLTGLFINNSTVVVTPTTGQTITVAQLTNCEIAAPAGLLAALTVQFPTPIADGHTFELVITQSITALTLTPNSGATIVDGGLSAVTTYGIFRFRYVAASTTWYLVP